LWASLSSSESSSQSFSTNTVPSKRMRRALKWSVREMILNLYDQ
jgi:hypothetical protein